MNAIEIKSQKLGSTTQLCLHNNGVTLIIFLSSSFVEERREMWEMSFRTASCFWAQILEEMGSIVLKLIYSFYDDGIEKYRLPFYTR